MKKVLVLVILSLFVATSVFAEGFALGWENGISCKMLLGPITGQGVIGFSNTSPENDNLDSYTSIDIAGYAAAPLVEMGDATMNWFGGLAFGTCTDDDLDIALRGGLQHDVMVTDNVSVSGKTGLQVFMDGGITDIKDTGSTTIGTWGTLGIYWHFD